MASLTIYRLSTEGQQNLFYSEDGKLNLSKIMETVQTKATPLGSDGSVRGEGFVFPSIEKRNNVYVIESYCTALANLGNYVENIFTDDQLTSRETQHHYYSKAKVIITEDHTLIAKYDNASEEKSKSKVKSIVEELGFEATMLRLDDPLLRKIQNKYEWSAAKIDKIERDGDKTTKVAYDIDVSNDQDKSQVHEIYNDNGKLHMLKFELPYTAPGAASKVTVKLYNLGNRIVLDEAELGNTSLEDFLVYLSNTIKEIEQEE